MTGGYVSWSHVLIRRWVVALLLLVGISVVAGGMGKSLPTSFIPEEDQGYAFVQIQLPDAASLQRTDAVMRKIDDMFAHTHGVKSLAAFPDSACSPTPLPPTPASTSFNWSHGRSARPRNSPRPG